MFYKSCGNNYVLNRVSGSSQDLKRETAQQFCLAVCTSEISLLAVYQTGAAEKVSVSLWGAGEELL